MIGELRKALSVSDILVLNQITTPDDGAWAYAEGEWAWDEEADNVKAGPYDIQIEFEHMAKGMEMSLPVFEQIAARLRTRINLFLKTGAVTEHLDPAVLRQLEAVFGMPPIPCVLEVKVVRQFLTITARNHHRKVTAEVAALLEAVGAKLPQCLAKRLDPPERR